MNTKKLLLLMAAGCLCVSHLAVSHGRYILPSHSNLSSDSPDIITVDVSISNDFFHPDMSYGGEPIMPNQDPMVRMTAENSQFIVLTPSGKEEKDHRLFDFGRKSVGAVSLKENGTFKIAMLQKPSYMTVFITAEGSPSRFPGKKNDVKDKIPTDAKNIRTLEITGRTEAYVSRNQLSTDVFKHTGVGLELVGGTHPNDLFVGESATLAFFLNGKPAPSGLPVAVTLGNTRFRNDRNTIELKTDEQGRIEVVWPAPGIYLLEMDSISPPQSKDADMGSTGLYITLEVSPD